MDGQMEGAAQQAEGKERVRHITNLQAGLSGARSSLERRAARERTRGDVTPPGGRCLLLPSSSSLNGTALSHASHPRGPAHPAGQTLVLRRDVWGGSGGQG